MTRFCIQCGAVLKPEARFCGSCGQAVGANPVAAQVTPPVANPIPSEVVAAADAVSEEPGRNGPNWPLIGGGVAILLLLLGYYFIFLRDDVNAPSAVVSRGQAVEQPVKAAQYYAVADANIRDRATTVGTTITGKLVRGTMASGAIILGEDGSTNWLKLADDKGFVAMSNLSETAPPDIVKLLGDRIWLTDKSIDIFAQADSSAAVLDTVAPGTALTLFGLTANDFIEIKLKKGGVGYIADGARIAELSAVKGKPIAIAFNPATCAFGGELGKEFATLGNAMTAAYKAAENRDYANDAEREKALGQIEGKSSYRRIERSFNGLSLTAIAQHYESQSVYFADPPDKVIAAFRAAGFKIGRDGQFPSTELYAGIGATAGEGRSYGKTDLSCGV